MLKPERTLLIKLLKPPKILWNLPNKPETMLKMGWNRLILIWQELKKHWMLLWKRLLKSEKSTTLPRTTCPQLNGTGNWLLTSFTLLNQERRRQTEPHQLLWLKDHCLTIMSTMVSAQSEEPPRQLHLEAAIPNLTHQSQEHLRSFLLEQMVIHWLQDTALFMDHVLRLQPRFQSETMSITTGTLITGSSTHSESREYY